MAEERFDLAGLILASRGTLDPLRLKLAGGDVKRYHTYATVPAQTVAAHSWRVAVIAAHLWPDRPGLPLAALYHDVAEGLTGDVPAPAKRALGEGLEHEGGIRRLELDYERYLGVAPSPPLNQEDFARLKCADYLELVAYIHDLGLNSPEAKLIAANGAAYVRDWAVKLPAPEYAPVMRLLVAFACEHVPQPATRVDPSPSGVATPREGAFDLGAGRVTAGDRFELLEFRNRGKYVSATLHPTGRYGRVVEVLRDGDADVTMDDGCPPNLVKWRQIYRVTPPYGDPV